MMPQLLAHLFGDYILQSDWMAQNKTKASLPAFCHALSYSSAFWLLAIYAHRPWLCWLAIFGTHFLIDRYRLARYVVWAKNWLGPSRPWWIVKGAWCSECPYGYEPDGYEERPTPPLSECPTGYPKETPLWLSTWLLIIADNTLHLAINYAALRWL
jgi:hypothetical protein